LHIDAPYTHPPDIVDFVKENQKRIKKGLVDGFKYDHLPIAKSDQFLRNHVFKKLEFAIMYIDVVGSTALSTKLAPDVLSKIATIFAQQVAYVIESFRGLVLKVVGDAVIGYFPYSSSQKSINEIVSCGQAVGKIIHIQPFRTTNSLTFKKA
jgi:hypothetical protein